MDPDSIDVDTVMSLSSRRPTTAVDGEIIALNEDRGAYYAAGATGSHILRMLDTPKSVRQLCAALQARYQVDGETCQRDVLAFLRELAREDIVEHAGS